MPNISTKYQMTNKKTVIKTKSSWPSENGQGGSLDMAMDGAGTIIAGEQRSKV